MEVIPVKTTARKVIPYALNLIKAHGGEMRLKDILEEINQNVKFADYENATTKGGRVRWQCVLQYYSIDAVKAGFLIKNNGTWILTAEGEKALANGDESFMLATKEGYEDWYSRREPKKDKAEFISSEYGLSLEVIKSQADESIREYVKGKNPYEFQDLVAALLRSMGYYTPFIAPKGRDGGIDIIAYQDPLGTMSPTLKVQVKHYPTSSISVDVVRSLVGVLTKDSEVGLIATSGKFTSEAILEARHSHQRIRLIDIDEFLSLWTEYYDKMSEEDKRLLPIAPVFFLNPNLDE